MKLAIYARFSSDLQSDDSIDDQIAVCRRWAERNGHEVVATFEDRAISGTKRARPGLQAILDEVERGKGRAFARCWSRARAGSRATSSARWS